MNMGHGATKTRCRLPIYYKRFVTRRNKIPPRQRVCRKQRLLTSFWILFEISKFQLLVTRLLARLLFLLLSDWNHSTLLSSSFFTVWKGDVLSAILYPSWFVEQRAYEKKLASQYGPGFRQRRSGSCRQLSLVLNEWGSCAVLFCCWCELGVGTHHLFQTACCCLSCSFPITCLFNVNPS